MEVPEVDSAKQLRLLGRELFLGQDPLVAELAELLQALDRIDFRRRRSCRYGRLGHGLLFFLTLPAGLLAAVDVV